MKFLTFYHSEVNENNIVFFLISGGRGGALNLGGGKIPRTPVHENVVDEEDGTKGADYLQNFGGERGDVLFLRPNKTY